MSKVKTHSEELVAPVQKVSNSFTSTLERLSARPSHSERRRAFTHILASPVHYEPNYAYPLLVWLHDTGKSEVEVLDVMPKISTQNFVAVAPRGLRTVSKRIVRRRINGLLVDEKSWTEPCNDWIETEAGVSEAENLVFDSIDQAMAKFSVNSRRIFLIGRGAGATMAMRVGMRNPNEFAGVISIDGAFPTLDNQLLRNWRAVRDLPILMTTGGASQISAQQLRLMHTAGMTVVIRQYNENHNLPNSAEVRMDKILADVNRWVMKRALNPLIPLSEMISQR